MLHEYAVDPNCLSTWDRFRAVAGGFGVGNGRIISDFPSQWIGLVKSGFVSAAPMQQKRFEALLKELRYAVAPLGRTYQPADSWVENSRVNHRQNFFRGIICDQIAQAGELLHIDEVCDLDRAWRLPTGPVPRIPREIVNSARLFLQISESIELLDPYLSFAPGDKYLETISEFCRIAFSPGRHTKLEKFWMHCLEARTGLESHYRDSLNYFAERCPVPNGNSLFILRWQCKKDEGESGEGFHGRYLLSERGGLAYDYGFKKGESGETTDVHRLTRETSMEKLRQLHPRTGEYIFRGGWCIRGRSVLPVHDTTTGFEIHHS